MVRGNFTPEQIINKLREAGCRPSGKMGQLEDIT